MKILKIIFVLSLGLALQLHAGDSEEDEWSFALLKGISTPDGVGELAQMNNNEDSFGFLQNEEDEGVSSSYSSGSCGNDTITAPQPIPPVQLTSYSESEKDDRPESSRNLLPEFKELVANNPIEKPITQSLQVHVSQPAGFVPFIKPLTNSKLCNRLQRKKAKLLDVILLNNTRDLFQGGYKIEQKDRDACSNFLQNEIRATIGQQYAIVNQGPSQKLMKLQVPVIKISSPFNSKIKKVELQSRASFNAYLNHQKSNLLSFTSGEMNLFSFK